MNIRHFDDIGFTVAWKLDGCMCKFIAYEIECPHIDGVQEREWHRKGSGSSPDSVDSLDLAQPYLRGDIKWDTCSNWHFDEQDRVMLHFCSKEQAVNIGRLFERMYDLAAEVIPNWDG